MFFSFWILGGRWFEVRVVRTPGDVGFLFFSCFFGVRPAGGNSWEFRGVRRISTRDQIRDWEEHGFIGKGTYDGVSGMAKKGRDYSEYCFLVVFLLGQMCFSG